MDKNIPPDFQSFHNSITDELFSIKNRIESLVKNHWLTVGEDKETALRSLLRRYLPESVIVGRGFIVTDDECSSQIDILIVDASKPTVFKDGDLLIVRPDSVLCVIEVKKTLKSHKSIVQAIIKLTKIEKICVKLTDEDPIWTGLFIFETSNNIKKKLLRALGVAINNMTEHVNCIAINENTLINYDRYYNGFGCRGHYWSDYPNTRIAPSGFISLLMKYIEIKWGKNDLSWAPMPKEFQEFKTLILPQGENIIRSLLDDDQLI